MSKEQSSPTALSEPQQGKLQSQLDALIPSKARAGALVIPSVLESLVLGHGRHE